MKRCTIILLSLALLFAFPKGVHAQQNYRFLALGDSLTIHGITENQWYSVCGMAASTPDKDWVHRVSTELEKKYGEVTTDVQSIAWEYMPEKLSEEEESVRKASENNPYDLVVIQNSDSISTQKAADVYENNLRSYISCIRQYSPNAQIVVINDFMGDYGFRDLNIAKACNKTISKLAKEMNFKIADLSAIANNRHYTANLGTTVYGDDGKAHTINSYAVANHPGDKGMEYIAYQVLKQIGITLNVGHDFDDLKNGKAIKDGWHKIKGKTYYYQNEKKLKGLNDIDDSFYYFDQKTGVLKTGIFKVRNETYYASNKGVVQLYKKGKYYYNHLNINQNIATGTELEAEYLADYYNKKINKKKTSKAKALKNAFKWAAKQKPAKKKLNTKAKGYPALMATSFFNKKGYAHAASYALAYLANSIGYKDISVKTYKNNVFTVINKKVCAPEAISNNYGSNYKKYLNSLKTSAKEKVKISSQKIPYSGTEKAKIIGKATKLVAWDAKSKKLYYNNGSVATGIVVYKRKFYAFDKLGVYNKKLTKKLRKAATYQKDVTDLFKLIGYPIVNTNFPSCYGDGTDIIYTYNKFNVSTFKSNDGKEVFISCSSH